MLRRTLLTNASYGFIGLGQMGGRMAPNLFKNADCDALYVYDTAAGSGDAVAKAAAGKAVHVCKDAAEVVANCKTVITMLPNGHVVRDVYGSFWDKVQPGTLFIDSSTVDPQTPKDLAAECAKRSARLVDAPVSGGVNAAAAGTLTFMVGGDDQTFNDAKKVLDAMGKNVVKCGDTGAGQVVKLCNNMILAQHMVAVSEAMLMGTRLGVDAGVLAGVVNTSTGRCWSSELYNPFPGVVANVPSSNNYAGGFGAALMLKDVKLAIDAADSVKLDVQGARNACAVYQKMVDSGMGGLDFSGVLKHIDQ
uniref:3-hydroxyisobutyrate dehydrogenase n=1 Tax=Neobodo designis TaxID=312471 RepID=A0A7S1MGX4_NEODS